MSSMVILGNIPGVIKLIRGYYEKSGVVFSDDPKLEANTEFLLLDPFYVGGCYLNYHAVYHRYFQLNKPDAKLVVIGFWQVKHPNYIDLFQLPDTLEYKLSQAKTAREEWMLNLGGANGMDILKAFFAGHGEGSLMNSLISLIPALNSSHNAVVHENEDWEHVFKVLIEPYSISGIEQFKQRWREYQNVMKRMPFYPKLDEVKKTIEDIGAHLNSTDESKKWFLNSDVSSKLKSAVDTLRQIESDYVRT